MQCEQPHVAPLITDACKLGPRERGKLARGTGRSAVALAIGHAFDGGSQSVGGDGHRVGAAGRLLGKGGRRRRSVAITGSSEVIKRSSGGHQQAIMRSSAGHQQIISRSSAGHQQVISRSSAGHQQVISRSSAAHQQLITCLAGQIASEACGLLIFPICDAIFLCQCIGATSTSQRP